jgi:L-ascorbate metabolism protein UlaG (beta-lactamase superfamily)
MIAKLVIPLVLLASAPAQQVEVARQGLINPALNLAENNHLNQQAEALLDAIQETLLRSPPQLVEPPDRRLALLMFDGVLHDKYAPLRPPVQQFFHRRMATGIADIRDSRVESGARIFKLYSHGFVVRTPTVTLGFDLVRAGSVRTEGFLIAETLIEQLVDACDVLFISHLHGDHADREVAQAFLDRGKPVVAPPEVWRGEPIHDRITHLQRVAHELQTLSVQGGDHQLRVALYPGHQGGRIENNVPLVFTPEGMSFAQTGDQSNSDDFAWIDEVSQHHQVDVLMPNCWTTDIARMVKGFDPALVITGHENEMGHTIDHREPYWLTYQRKTGSSRFGGDPDVGYAHPLVLMTWGESYHYRPGVR